MLFVPLAAALASEPADAARSWLLTERLAMEMKLPVKGWTRAETTAVWLVDWAPGEPALSARLCAIDVAPLYGVTMTFSPGLVASLPVQTRPVREEGDRWTVPTFAYAFGRSDDDGDGEPGVAATLSLPILGKGELAIVQEATLALEGARQADGVVRGATVWSQRQEILKSSRSFLQKPLDSRDAAEPGSFELAPHADARCP